MLVLIFLIILLFFALLPLPYGYYILLRFFICFGLIYEVITKTKLDTETITIFIALAILYNPIIKMPLGKPIWMIVNVLTAIYFAYQLYERRV